MAFFRCRVRGGDSKRTEGHRTSKHATRRRVQLHGEDTAPEGAEGKVVILSHHSCTIGSGDHAHNDSHARVTGHAGVVDHTIFSRLMSTRRVTEQDADRAVVELRSALNQTRAKAMCRRADSRPIGASGRLGLPSATFCNASFLLTRMRERADGQR